ncbi:hypothetical protein BJ508DRAFT_118198 [Ascobolus immersus RN42]|uniref:Uncharacterized protein n=1 Tax=Ascobolus immersus RN42 TaxID=1160509 RepID=A0A3N4IA01_ASCIM|nr:hypothetical protein BJ508DRAFT_118198 [Ascobolus immersus RN42]
MTNRLTGNLRSTPLAPHVDGTCQHASPSFPASLPASYLPIPHTTSPPTITTFHTSQPPQIHPASLFLPPPVKAPYFTQRQPSRLSFQRR